MRLKTRGDFAACYETGRKQHSPSFVVFVRRVEHAPSLPEGGCSDEPAIVAGDAELRLRLGVSASKKTGKANRRNRFKRIVREFFRLNRARIAEWVVKGQESGDSVSTPALNPPFAPLDVVIVVKRGVDARTMTLASAQAELLPALKRAVSVALVRGNRTVEPS